MYGFVLSKLTPTDNEQPSSYNWVRRNPGDAEGYLPVRALSLDTRHQRPLISISFLRVLAVTMESKPAGDVGSWRKLVKLGKGRTGSVALCIEPTSSAAANTCADQNGVLHAVKRMDRQSTTNSVAVRRILQEKKALQVLQGV